MWLYYGSYNLQVVAETMDADRDKVQEELMANLIAGGGNTGGGDADVTATYLNDSGEGAEDLERRDGSCEGEDDVSGTLVISKSTEVYKLSRCWLDALTDLYIYIDNEFFLF